MRLVVARHSSFKYRRPPDLRRSSASELSAQIYSPWVKVYHTGVTQRMQPGRARLQASVQIDCHPALHQPSGLASSPASAQHACLSHRDQRLRRDRSLRRRNAAKFDTATAQCLTTRPALVNTQEYRRNVGICLVNSQGLVFAARSECQ